MVGVDSTTHCNDVQVLCHIIYQIFSWLAVKYITVDDACLRNLIENSNRNVL